MISDGPIEENSDLGTSANVQTESRLSRSKDHPIPIQTILLQHVLALKKQLKDMETIQAQHTVLLNEILASFNSPAIFNKPSEDVQLPTLPFSSMQVMMDFDVLLGENKDVSRVFVRNWT